MEEEIRFLDLLTTATAVANFRGSDTVCAEHFEIAADILRGLKSMDETGGPGSLPVSRGAGGNVAPALQELVQDWYRRLGGDPDATIDDDALEVFLAEARAAERKAGTHAESARLQQRKE